MKKLSLLFFIGIFLIGCAITPSTYISTSEYGTEALTDENIDKIQKGITTQEDVLNLFGEPASKTRTSSELSWTYLHSKSKVILNTWGKYDPSDSLTKMLIIFFDSNGLVKDYNYTTSGHYIKGKTDFKKIE